MATSSWTFLMFILPLYIAFVVVSYDIGEILLRNTIIIKLKKL